MGGGNVGRGEGLASREDQGSPDLKPLECRTLELVELANSLFMART